MLVLSKLFASLGFLVYSLSSTFFPFALAIMLMAIKEALFSGTSNALLYDSLKSMGREGDFEKILGRTRLLEIVSVSFAGILGSYLASHNIRFPFIISIFTSLLAALIAWTFKEPEIIHTSTGEVEYFEHIKQAAKFVLTSPFIRFLLIYLVLMDTALSSLDEYDQLYLILINFPLAYFGVWISLRRGLGGLGGLFAERFKAGFTGFRGPTKTTALLFMAVSLLAVSLASKYIGLLAFLIIFPIWGVAEVLIFGELHSQVESHQRATIESLVIFFALIIDMPIRLSFGYVSDVFGIRTGYLFMAAVLIVYLPYFFWSKRKGSIEVVKSDH